MILFDLLTVFTIIAVVLVLLSILYYIWRSGLVKYIERVITRIRLRNWE